MAYGWTRRIHPAPRSRGAIVCHRNHPMVEFACTGPLCPSDLGRDRCHWSSTPSREHRCFGEHLREHQFDSCDRTVHAASPGLAARTSPSSRGMGHSTMVGVSIDGRRRGLLWRTFDTLLLTGTSRSRNVGQERPTVADYQPALGVPAEQGPRLKAAAAGGAAAGLLFGGAPAILAAPTAALGACVFALGLGVAVRGNA